MQSCFGYSGISWLHIHLFSHLFDWTCRKKKRQQPSALTKPNFQDYWNSFATGVRQSPGLLCDLVVHVDHSSSPMDNGASTSQPAKCLQMVSDSYRSTQEMHLTDTLSLLFQGVSVGRLATLSTEAVWEYLKTILAVHCKKTGQVIALWTCSLA